MVIPFSIQLVGRTGNTGCYLLLIRLRRNQEIRFGRFNNGRMVNLPKGFYLYIGSARGQRGASSLGYRLLRHTTRSGAKPPHATQKLLHVSLQDAGIPSKVPAEKRIHWHIDHLIDLMDAEIEGVLVIRGTDVDEKQLAERLTALPETSIPARGLGAGDHPGGTHLLSIDNAEEFWRMLPNWINSQSFLGDGMIKI